MNGVIIIIAKILIIFLKANFKGKNIMISLLLVKFILYVIVYYF